MPKACATSSSPPTATPSADAVAAADAASDLNRAITNQYRSKRCPRWRLRGPATRRRSRQKTLLYDGSGPPFEKATETRDGIAVWMRASPGVDVKEVLAETTFHDTPRDKLWRAINDVDRYCEFVPFVRKCVVVKRDARHAWVYNVVKPPVASPRDYTIRIEATPAKSRDEPHVSSWTIDDEEGPEVERGTIRLVQNTGSWELREIGSEGTGTVLRYRILTDPGAALPGWLVDVANQTSVPDVLRAFHKRANSGIYEREDAGRAALHSLGLSQTSSWLGLETSGLFSVQGMKLEILTWE